MTNELNNVPSSSIDLTEQNIKKLKELFPEIMTEKKIDFEKLRVILGDEIDDSPERYNFTWNGKKQAIQLAQQPTTATLKPNKEKSKNWDETQNLYIEGDNLEVLKLLQKSYANKVKMIYIDPPYNTGKDFVYKDNFHDSLQNYLEQTGQIDSEGNKLGTNSETSGRYHTDWLNMIYPRLKLARNLLTEDGVIFVSIDDNEVENLRKIMDEIFGENNFIAQLIWERAFSPKNDAKYVSNSHDYIFMYAKSLDTFKIGRLPRTEEANARYSNPDDDPRGPWMSGDISVKTYSESADYPITLPSGRVVEPPAGRSWSLSKNGFSERLQDNRIWFGPDGDGVPRMKRFLSELKHEGMAPTSILFHKDVGHSQEGSQEVKKIMDNGDFDGPKPTRLMRRLLTIANLSDDDMVLDFFSGSSSTADAVMHMNVSSNKKVKFVMVQLPENLSEKSSAYKDGYKTIPEIAEERIRRAGEKILSENQELRGKLDVGFKVFELQKSNLKKWNSESMDLLAELDTIEDNLEEGSTIDDLVYEIMLKQGLELTLPIEEAESGSSKIYKVAFGALFIVLGKDITSDVATKIIEVVKSDELENLSVVLQDTGFTTDSEKLNAIEILNASGVQYDDILSI